MEEKFSKKTIVLLIAAFVVGFICGGLGKGINVINMNGSNNSKLIIGNNNSRKE